MPNEDSHGGKAQGQFPRVLVTKKEGMGGDPGPAECISCISSCRLTDSSTLTRGRKGCFSRTLDQQTSYIVFGSDFLNSSGPAGCIASVGGRQLVVVVVWAWILGLPWQFGNGDGKNGFHKVGR